jgi:hypothetical protein
MAEESITIQGFTRVHMVPRVNQGRTVAFVYELPSTPPVAYGAPVQVLQQLFLRIPQVLADAKKVRAEAGLVDAPDAPDAPAMVALPWAVESLTPLLSADGQLTLAVQMNDCRVDLALSSEQGLQLLTALTSLVEAKPAAKKVQKAIKPTAQATMTEATRPKVDAKTAAKPVADKKKVAAKKAVK